MALKIKGWNWFEITWLALFSTIILILTFFWKSDLLSVTVYLTGVLCVVLVAKGNIWNYPFGIYNSIGYSWISYQNGLFGEVMLNMLFFLPTSIIGWLMWRKKIQDHRVIMRKMKWQSVLGYILLCIVAAGAMGQWLATIEGQNTPYLDAFNVAASVLATLAMLGRYRDQWFLYITINLAQITMWTFRLMDGSPEAATMIVMWSAYLINSVYGLYVWSKGSQTPGVQQEKTEQMMA